MDPQQLGPYTLESTLGRGGMATVYLAREIAGRKVALKLMHPQLAQEPLLVERFVREIEATRELKHPNLVEVYAAGEIDGRLVMACELCDGGSVEALLGKTRKLSAALTLEIAAQLFEGLAYAHGQGLVHRDLKPANLLLTRRGQLKIGDFGIARTLGETRLTRTGLMMGTPGYVSPEQAQGKPVDARSDLFSAGVVLYELLSGQSPHEAPDATAMLARVMRGALPLAAVEETVPPGLEALVDRLLSLDPLQRPASAAEALFAVRALQPAPQESLIAEALARPLATHERLNAEQAAVYDGQARALLAETPPRRGPAALWLHRAVLLEPGNQRRAREFAALCERERLSFGSPGSAGRSSGNPRLRELEAQLEAAPDNAKLLLQIAQLYRLEGNLARTAAFLKRALRLRPRDAYVAAQLGQLTGERRALSATTSGPLSTARAGEARGAVTANMTAGIDTGGFSAEEEHPAAPAGAAPLGQLVPPVSPASGLQLFWRRYGTVASGLIVVCLLGVGSIRAVGWFLRSSSKGTAQAAAELSRSIARGALAPPPPPASAAAPIAANPTKPTEQGPVPEQNSAPPHRRLLVDGDSTLEGQLAAHARDAAERLSLATQALRSREYGRAIDESEQLIAVYPKRPEAEQAALIRARSLLGAARNGPARDAFVQFRRDHPGSPQNAEALLGEGRAASQLGDDAAALTALDELLGDSRDSAFALEAQLLRGQLRLRGGDAASARADLRQVLARTGPADQLHREAKAALSSMPPR